MGTNADNCTLDIKIMNHETLINPFSDPVAFSRARRELLIARATLKRNSVLGGLAAKARLIVDGKGRNGQSMSPALLERHMANR